MLFLIYLDLNTIIIHIIVQYTALLLFRIKLNNNSLFLFRLNKKI